MEFILIPFGDEVIRVRCLERVRLASELRTAQMQKTF